MAVLRKSGRADADTPAEAVDDLLAVTTYDGITVRPLYTRDTVPAQVGVLGAAPFTRGSRPPGQPGWDIRAHHADPDAKATNEAILADLEGGASSVWLELGGAGLATADLATALRGVYLDLADVVLDAGPETEAAAAALFALAPDGQPRGNLGADPLGWQARTGDPADLTVATRLAQRCAGVAGPGVARLRAITVDATPYHDAGGSDAQELGCAVATGLAYLRSLTAAGLDLPAAFGQLEFRYAASADQFLTIAKLRAARRLWARVAEVCAVPEAGAQRQHAVTSSAMISARDPWVNLLRTTLACFAAGAGGADAVTVQPFDTALGLPDAFSRRIARNTQSLLLEESQVARVADPAGGCWYVERLTEDLATVAWDWFTEIERNGGMAAALHTGLVADRLAATWARRADNLAHRRDALIGVSEFPNLAERLPVRPPRHRPPHHRPPQPSGGGLPRHRYAEVFETIRDRADAHAQSHDGNRPTVFLATLGPLSAYTARTSFASNLFAAGGIATVVSGSAGLVATVPGSGDEVEQTVAAFASTATTVACLCSNDKLYERDAARLATALRAAGATRVWLAGRPAGYEGVDSYVYSGCDAVEVLNTTLRDLAVA